MTFKFEYKTPSHTEFSLSQKLKNKKFKDNDTW